MRKKYQRQDRKSNPKLGVVGEQELLVRVPLPMAEVWAEMQAQVEQLTGQAGLQILRAILENEVTRRVGPPHRPHPTAGCVRWGKHIGMLTAELAEQFGELVVDLLQLLNTGHSGTFYDRVRTIIISETTLAAIFGSLVVHWVPA